VEAKFEPATLRTKGDESTNEPPRPTIGTIVGCPYNFIGLDYIVGSLGLDSNT